MKDDKERVELTFADIRRAAEKCPTAKAVLSDLVPKAFKKNEEWEDITHELRLRPGWIPLDERALPNRILAVEHPDFGGTHFYVVLRENQSDFKIENGRAYHRKE